MKNDDMISRVAAIQIAERYGCNNGSALGHHSGAADCIASEIATLPAVDAAPVVHAHWIETKIPANTTGHGGVGQDKKNGWLCSNCRCAFDAKLLWCQNYCPNCGALMNEEWKTNDTE